jgi:hypothetical protein
MPWHVENRGEFLVVIDDSNGCAIYTYDNHREAMSQLKILNANVQENLYLPAMICTENQKAMHIHAVLLDGRIFNALSLAERWCELRGLKERPAEIGWW